MLGYCGLNCNECEAFIATVKDDDALRAKVAGEWTERYGVPISADYINCTGCRSEGAKVHYCDQLCAIRKCAAAAKLGTCAECGSYACGKLEEAFRLAPELKDKLEALRAERG